MPAIGITGGVASGKSTLTKLLADRLKAGVFDSDFFVHELLRSSPEVIAEIRLQFGNEVMTKEGSVDRGELGKLVFADPARRRSLEAIVHPHVRKGWKSAMMAPAAATGWWLIDIPLLFETDADRELPSTILVGCSRPIQLERLERLRGIGREQAVRMIDAQMEMSEKVKRASYVIWNDGSIDALRGQTDLLVDTLLFQ